jgi:hypothetical protein
VHRTLRNVNIIVGALAAATFLFASGAVQADPTPPGAYRLPGAFTIYPCQTLASFYKQLETSETVRERYAEVYGIAPSAVPAKFKGLTVGLLPTSMMAKMCYVTTTGGIKHKVSSFPAGCLVAFSHQGIPCLRWSCGNPIFPLHWKAWTPVVMAPVTPTPVITPTPPVVTPPTPPAPPVVVPPTPPTPPVVVPPTPPPTPPVVIVPKPEPVALPYSVMAGILFSGNAAAQYDASKVQFTGGFEYDDESYRHTGVVPLLYADYNGGPEKPLYINNYGLGIGIRTYSPPDTLSPYIGAAYGIYGTEVQDPTQRESLYLGAGKVFVGLDTPSGIFIQTGYLFERNVIGANPGGYSVELGFRF